MVKLLLFLRFLNHNSILYHINFGKVDKSDADFVQVPDVQVHDDQVHNNHVYRHHNFHSIHHVRIHHILRIHMKHKVHKLRSEDRNVHLPQIPYFSLRSMQVSLPHVVLAV